jgi:hypothetical protein
MNNFVATVEYVDNRGPQYDFFCNIEGLKKGDTVVAQSRHGLGICRVMSIKEKSGKANAWIICKVDVEAHNNKVMIEIKQQELNTKMRDHLNRMSEAEVFRAIAETDEKMAQLLDRWWDLENKKQGRG